MTVQMTLEDLRLTHLRIVAQADAHEAVCLAAQELCGLLASEGVSAAVATASPGATETAGDIVLLSDGDCERDGFRITHASGRITIRGSNPRSVLYGVYRLCDWLRGDRDSDVLDIAEEAHFVERWMPATLHGRTDDIRNFRYLARLGVNTSYLRGRRDAFIEVKHLTHYVRDDVYLPQISRACPPNEGLVAMAQGAYRLARQFGFEVTMFQDEPEAIESPGRSNEHAGDALPAGLADELPADMLGEASLGHYRRDGWKALSVFHPKVQDHYRQLLREVLTMFPRLRTLYVYNEDAGASNVWPPTEPAARDAYPPGYQGYPYAAHLHLVKILQEAGEALRPGFRVATVTYHWFLPDELRRKMVSGLPDGAVLLSLAAWDDSVDTSRLPAWTQDLCVQVARRGELTFLADDDFNGTSDDLLMEITAGLPMPHRTWRKCRMWAQAGATGLTQHHTGGPTLGLNAITDLAFREFTWRPLASLEQADAWMLAVLRRQLGTDAAAGAMMAACRAVDRALDAVEEQVDHRPYCSRLHHSAKVSFPPHLEEGLRRTGSPSADYCGDGIDPAIWQTMLEKEMAEYAEAAGNARRAAELAPDDRRPFYLLYDSGASTTCREYARVMVNAIEIVLAFKRTFLNFLRAEQAAREADLVSVWQDELSNTKCMLELLDCRRKWMQSPYGVRILERYAGQFRRKIELLQRHIGHAGSCLPT